METIEQADLSQLFQKNYGERKLLCGNLRKDVFCSILIYNNFRRITPPKPPFSKVDLYARAHHVSENEQDSRTLRLANSSFYAVNSVFRDNRAISDGAFFICVRLLLEASRFAV